MAEQWNRRYAGPAPMRAASPSSTVASVAGEQLAPPDDVVREVAASLLGGDGVEVEHLPICRARSNSGANSDQGF